MDVPAAIRRARRRAGISQSELAARAGTSQATVSAYETGRKAPSVETLTRLLAATGSRLSVEPGVLRELSRSDHARTARGLAEVLALAEALPKRHEPTLRYPRLAA
jgi:transcriptional regulator with XRE-family HTH domain